MTFGELVSEARQELNLSVLELAHRAGIDGATLRYASRAIVLKLAHILGLDPDVALVCAGYAPDIPHQVLLDADWELGLLPELHQALADLSQLSREEQLGALPFFSAHQLQQAS